MSLWLQKIMSQRAAVLEAGRTPVAILIHPKIIRELREEFELKYYMIDNYAPIETLLGMKVLVISSIPNFQIIDDRNWADQIFTKD
jgi:hypothetical protein